MLMPSFTATCSSTGAKTALCVTDSKQATTSGIALTGLALAMVTLVLPTAAQIPGHVPSDDALVAFYPLDNGIWTDLSVNGWNSGTNAPAVDRHGVVGGCADFSAPSAFQDVVINNLNLGAAEFTISFWYRTLDPSQTLQTFFNTSPHNGIGANLNFHTTPQKLTLFYGNGSGWTYAYAGPSGSTFVDSDWHHLVIRKSGLVVEMIVDDQTEYSNTLGSATPSFFPDHLHFGSIAGGGAEIFNGYLDEVGIWSRALTDLELTALNTGGALLELDSSILFAANPDLGPDVTGIRLRPMSSSDGPSDFAFDAFDLARDEHHVALRLNGTGMAGGELERADGSAPIVTVVPAGLDIPHSAISDTSILPITGSPTQVEMGSATGAAISFLIINGQPPLPESLVDLLTPVDNGLPEWTGFTTFDDDPTQWQEWAAVVEDPILMADMLGDAAAATYTATIAQVVGTAWEELSVGARCDYNSDASNVEAFGRLYNWYAVSETAGLCPSGWHVPTDDEWTALETYVSANGHSGTEATALKATSGWNNGGNGTDDFGFSCVPAGYRYSDGDFYDQGNFGSFWSSSADGSNAWFRDFITNQQTISLGSDIPQLGHSVRCLRDAEFQDCVSPTMDEYDYEVVAVGDQCWFAENLRTKVFSDGTPIPTYQNDTFTTFTTDTLIAGYHFGDLDLASADFDALNGLVRNEIGGNNCQDPVADYLGNHYYDVVAIGDQCWFAENVTTGQLNNGAGIDYLTGHSPTSGSWDGVPHPITNHWNNQGCEVGLHGVCPGDWITMDALFGNVYNGHTVTSPAGICPSGWHVPSAPEFQALIDHAEAAFPGQSSLALMNPETFAPGSAFSGSTTTYQGFDAFGFNGTAHGTIISNWSDVGYNIGLYGGYWTSSYIPDPYGQGLVYLNSMYLDSRNPTASISSSYISGGAAIRCLRDEPVVATLGYPFEVLPEIRPLEGSADSMGLWAEHADVQSFQSHHLATRYEAGETFAEGELHVSFPITAPLYDGETFEDVPYTGADAVAASLPYWGFPNGVEGYAELYVEVTSVDNPSVKYTVTVNSEDSPLMNKDCPFLIQDSLRTAIPMDVLTAAGFQPGQPVDVSAMAFWATPARRTSLFSHNHIQNREILCTEIDPALQANLVPDTARIGTTTELTLTFNDAFPSSGGYLRIQRRDASDADAPDGGWSYLMEQTDGSYLTTTDRSAATVWRNLDADADGTVDPFTIMDALPDFPWKCKQVQYRLEQDMCGTYFAGPEVGVHIIGDINTPWTVDGALQQEIEVSKGDYPFKVKLQWGNSTDQEELVDQFRIYRRLYTTHVDTGVGWTQVFSTEDLLTYEDEDLAAGLLYEYKVGALMTCGDGNGNEVVVEFFPPYPNDIGFRSSFGSVSGTILYEDGVTPSGDVRVELQPQGQNDARKSIKLGDDHYIAFNLGDLTENSSITWPDLHTTQDGEIMTLSQWIKWESADIGPNPDPLMAANMVNAEGNVIEAFALWGDTADAAPGHYRLNLRQENIRRDFTDIEFKFDEWHHVLLTLEEGTTNGIGYSVTLSTHPDQLEKVDRSEQTLEFLQMTPEKYEELRTGWDSFTWNGAVAPDTACTDPFSTNFNPLLINGSAQFCLESYAAEDAGCADPLIAATPAGYDLPLSVEGACDYGAVATGDLISVRWFSDASPTPDEFPVIYRMDGGNEVEVARFDSELTALHTAGLDSTGASTYAYSMPVLTTQLVPGDYRIRVLDKSTGSETDASDFSGNFSVRNDRGQEYVNCIQYLPSEVVNGEYDFSVLSPGCAVNTADDAVTVLTDCAECYSIGIAPGSTYELALGTGGADHLATSGFSLAFWFKAAAGTSDLLTIEDRNDPTKTLVLSAIPEAYPDAGPLRLGYTGTRLAMTGTGSTAGTLARHDSLPSTVYNMFGLQPGQWYHAVLEMTATTGGILTLRSTDLNNGDAEPWNNTRTFDFTAEGQYSAPIDHIDPASIRFGSAASTAQVTVHGASLWTSSLLPAQQTALFEGISTDGLYADGALLNQQGAWQGTANLPLDALAAVLVPNNTGQFVDHMAGKHLKGLGGLNGTTGLSEPLFAYGTLNTAADSAGVIMGLTAIGSGSSGQFSVRSAPWGTCIPGCSRLETACNFNPFASLYTPCDISCTGAQFVVEQLSTGHWHLDEIRGFKGASPLAYGEDRLDPYTTREAADFWMHQYPDPLTEGLFWMLDLDENVGNALYDRSKYGLDQDSWTKNHAHILHQHIDEAGVTTMNAAWDGHDHYRDATPLSLNNFDNTAQTDGKYSIGNVKYVGASSIFDVIPAKSSGGFAHDFMPPQSLALVGDLVLNSTDIDFTDVSAFEVDLNVHYQDIQTGHPDYSGTGDPMASNCPVKGVRFKVDGVLLRDDQQEPFETDELGRLTISVSRGEHTIEPIFTHLDEEGTDDDHTFNSTPTSGKVVYVTGPSPRNFDGSVDPQFQFIDVTTRRIVGRVIGGEVQAAKEWDASQNNLGIASFQLVKENPVENSESFSLAHTCPAVQVTTDIKGQYDVLVTPGHYRMATPHDAAGFPAIFSKNDYSDLDVMGWEGEPVDSWVHAFRDATKDDGEGNYNINDPAYAQWKTIEKTAWNQEEHYPDKSIDGEAMPSNAYHRVDLVHRPTPQISVEQRQVGDDATCTTDRHPDLNTGLGRTFWAKPIL